MSCMLTGQGKRHGHAVADMYIVYNQNGSKKNHSAQRNPWSLHATHYATHPKETRYQEEGMC